LVGWYRRAGRSALPAGCCQRDLFRHRQAGSLDADRQSWFKLVV